MGLRLNHKDLETISRGVRDLYAVTRLDLVPAACIALLARLIPSESISFNEFGTNNGRVISIIEPEPTNFQQALPIFAAHISEHPVIRHFRENHSFNPLKISDLCPDRKFYETGLYRDFYRTFEVKRQFGFFLSRSEQAETCIAINRGGRDFSERDRRVITLLQPHFAQALANASEVSSLREALGFLEGAAETCQKGAAWLDRGAHILFITRVANRWLSEFFPTRSSPSVLPQDVWNWVQRQLSSDLALREPLFVRRGDRSLRIGVAEEGARLLLFLSRSCETVLPEVFIPYGLTPREAEVLQWMAEGKSSREIGRILGSSPRTVDKHVERVLTKLHVETRKAAMLRAWQILHP